MEKVRNDDCRIGWKIRDNYYPMESVRNDDGLGQDYIIFVLPLIRSSTIDLNLANLFSLL